MSEERIYEKLIELAASQKEILANQKHQEKILEDQAETLKQHQEILTRNTLTVEEHHRRSLHLEEQVDLLKEELKPALEHVRDLEAQKRLFKWISAILGVISTAIGIYYTITKIGG